MIPIHTPWTRQPQGAVRATTTGPLSSGLCFLIAHQASGIDVVRGRLPTSSNLASAPEAAARWGAVSAQTTNGSSQYQEHAASLLAFGAGAFSVSFLIRSDPLAAGSATVIGNNRSGTASGFMIDRTSTSKLKINTAASFATSLTTSADVVDNKWHIATITRTTSGVYQWYVDGAVDSTSTTSAYNVDSGFDAMLGAQRTGTTPINYIWGAFGLCAGHNRALQAAEVKALHGNPWQLFAPLERRIWVPSAGGGPTHTIVADAATYTLTGAAAGLTVSRKIVAGSGAYAITGANTNLKVSRKLSAAAGSYALTGGNVTLKAARKLVAGSGSYALTGAVVTFNYSGSGATYTLTADSGSYTFTTAAANLLVSRKLVAGVGAYTLTGSSVTLSYSGDTSVTIPTMPPYITVYMWQRTA